MSSPDFFHSAPRPRSPRTPVRFFVERQASAAIGADYEAAREAAFLH